MLAYVCPQLSSQKHDGGIPGAPENRAAAVLDASAVFEDFTLDEAKLLKDA